MSRHCSGARGHYRRRHSGRRPIPPKDTPAEVVARLNGALVKALDNEATRKRLLELGSNIPDRDSRSPEALQKLVASEVARWMPVLKAAGATAN